MPTYVMLTNLTPDGVKFIDKNDARSLCFRLLEQIPNTRCAHSDEHFDEIAPTQRVKRHVRLARDCPGQ